MDPGFVRPISDAAGKRTFGLGEISHDVARVLSKDRRHALLPSPHDRYGDAREHNAKTSGKQQEIHHQLHPHPRPAVMIHAVCRGASPVHSVMLRLKPPSYSRSVPSL
jgi:hypothetical protein